MKTLLLTFAFFLMLTNMQGQKYQPGLNLTPGDVYFHQMESEVTVKQGFGPREMELSVSFDNEIAYRVKAFEDSVYELQVHYENMSMKSETPFGNMAFSTDSDDENPLSFLLKEMKHKPFSIEMLKNGKIRRVEGFDFLLHEAMDGFEQISDLQMQQSRQQIGETFGDNSIKENIELVTAIFPETEVAVGDQWTINTRLESLSDALLEIVYVLEEVTDTSYLIRGKGKFETDPGEAEFPMGGIPLAFDVEGTLFSEIHVDRQTGWVIDSEIIQVISGEVTSENPETGETMVIFMVMTNKTTITP